MTRKHLESFKLTDSLLHVYRLFWLFQAKMENIYNFIKCISSNSSSFLMNCTENNHLNPSFLRFIIMKTGDAFITKSASANQRSSKLKLMLMIFRDFFLFGVLRPVGPQELRFLILEAKQITRVIFEAWENGVRFIYFCVSSQRHTNTGFDYPTWFK